MTKPVSPARQQFVDDELLRVPMVADQVLDATWVALQDASGGLSPHERAAAADLLQAGPGQRTRLVERFAASVREQVRAELGGAVAAAPAAAVAPKPMLSLLDENEVAADVEISRAIEAIKSVAEHELRELATFTSALAGDMDVARDHNPFRAETYARAMWEAAQALPMARGYQVMLMRHAATPLAQVLRKAYAGACARLESCGIEPAVYRTLILPGGSRSTRPGDTWQNQAPDLQRIRETMPAPMDDPAAQRTSEMPLDRVIDDADHALRSLPQDAPPTVRAQLLESQRARMVRHARSTADQQLIELLGRLFEMMLWDKRVARDIRSVLARLQPSTLRLVLRDTAALDDYAHPVWRFMDKVAYLAALHPDASAGREEILRLTETLVDEIAREPAPDADLYRRALKRLAADDRARLEARIARAHDDIAVLQALEDRLLDTQSGVPTGMGLLDEGQLDTVPAALLDSLPDPRGDAPDTTTWLAQRHTGDWVRMFHQGQWIRAQLLWRGRQGDVWLFGHGQTDRTTALRRRALERLHAEGLLTTLRVRSMLRSAAVQLLRASGQAPA